MSKDHHAEIDRLPTLEDVSSPIAKMWKPRVTPPDPNRPKANIGPAPGREAAFREAFRGLHHIRSSTGLALRDLEMEMVKQLLAAGIAELVR